MLCAEIWSHLKRKLFYFSLLQVSSVRLWLLVRVYQNEWKLFPKLSHPQEPSWRFKLFIDNSLNENSTHEQQKLKNREKFSLLTFFLFIPSSCRIMFALSNLFAFSINYSLAMDPFQTWDTSRAHGICTILMKRKHNKNEMKFPFPKYTTENEGFLSRLILIISLSWLSILLIRMIFINIKLGIDTKTYFLVFSFCLR